MASQIFDRFSTPVAKLVQFFEGSRDQWKSKAISLRKDKKLMANQIRAVCKSRDSWKERAKTAQRQVEQMEREIALLKCRT